MADVKPAEVSAILREQLSGFKTEAQLEEIEPYFKLEMVSLEFMGSQMLNQEN